MAAAAPMHDGQNLLSPAVQASVLDPFEIPRSVLDSMAEGAIAVDEKGQILLFNPAAGRILRRGATRAAPDRWTEFYGCFLPDKVTPYPPEQLPLARAMRGEAVDEAEVFVRHDGVPEGAWLIVNGRPLRDSTGALKGGVIVFRDVTARRRAEEALRHSAEHYRSLIENVLDVIQVVDADGTLLYESPSVEKLSGYRPDELAGKNAFDLIHPEDRPKVEEVFQAALKNPGVTYSTELRSQHRDGSWRYFESTGKALGDETGRTHLVVTSRDITERKRAEEQILFQASLLDQVHNAVIAVDVDRKIVYWNRYAELLLQWKREEVLGRHIATVAVNWRRSEEISRSVDLSGHWDGELLIDRKNGTSFPGRLAVSAVRDSQGRVIGRVGVSSDISDRKQAEEQLRTSREQLRRLAAHLDSVREEERTRIAREIHDQLGQALTALILELSQIARRVPDNRELLDQVGVVSQLANGAIEIVQRIASELRPVILDDLGLAVAIEWQMMEFQSRTGIECVLQRTASEIGISRAVSTAVFRIFQEILTNVARHAGANSIKVTLREIRGHLILHVRDNGRGITKEQAADPAALGLLGMQERALRWGGRVRIRGVAGKGTSVTVRIPLRKRGSRTGGRNRGD